MATTQHKRWVKEAKSQVICVIDKPNLRELHNFEAISTSWLCAIPANPKKFHALHQLVHCSGACMKHTDMENPQYTSIPEQVAIRSSFT
jgi:hypothetical protein